MTIRNKFPALKRAIQQDASDESRSTVARFAAGAVKDVAIRHLKRLTPFKTQETHMTTGHTDHTSIMDGWVEDLPIMTVNGVANAKITNVSEHIDWQRDGIEGGYTMQVPERQAMYFWIGPPLKWPVVNPDRFYFGAQGGFATLQKVERKQRVDPWGGSDFVERAAREGRHEMDRRFGQWVGDTIFASIEEFFGA